MHRSILAALLVSLAATAVAQTPAERWDVTSTVVDMTVSGAPGFLLRMARGKSRAEHKCVAAGAGAAALLAPDPKARCRIVRQEIADGRYRQVLACPQKRGAPLEIDRTGNYTPNGFSGRADVRGQTPKGALHIVLDQRAARAKGMCRGASTP